MRQGVRYYCAASHHDQLCVVQGVLQPRCPSPPCSRGEPTWRTLPAGTGPAASPDSIHSTAQDIYSHQPCQLLCKGTCLHDSWHTADMQSVGPVRIVRLVHASTCSASCFVAGAQHSAAYARHLCTTQWRILSLCPTGGSERCREGCFSTGGIRAGRDTPGLRRC